MMQLYYNHIFAVCKGLLKKIYFFPVQCPFRRGFPPVFPAESGFAPGMTAQLMAGNATPDGRFAVANHW
jgi:hypothetical protein